MSPKLSRLAVRLSLCSAVILPPALIAQFKGFGTGKLVIQSAPHTGASIFINNNATNRQTNSTFVVSQGTYWVAVTGGPDHLNCGGESGKATITPGSVVTLTCTATGFQPR